MSNRGAILVVYLLCLIAVICFGMGILTVPKAHAASEKPPECVTLDAFKVKGGKMVAALENLAKAEGRPLDKIVLPDTFTKVSPGAYHFLEGVYTMNPLTPAGLPPGDGALLATTKGKDGGSLLWTRAALVCGSAMSVPKVLLDLMRKVKDAPGEDKEDMRL